VCVNQALLAISSHVVLFALCSSGVVSPSSASAERASESMPILSGLYSYHIPTNTWTKLRDNQLEPQPKLGQSMIFHPVCNSVVEVLDIVRLLSGKVSLACKRFHYELSRGVLRDV